MENAQPHYAPGQQQQHWEDPRAQLHGNVEQFMAKVFGLMAIAIAVTAGVAYGVGSAALTNQSVAEFIFGPTRWLLLFAPVIFVWIMGSRIPSLSPAGATATLFVHASLVGLMFANIPAIIAFGSASGLEEGVALADKLTFAVGGALAVTVGMYVVTALFGFFTKKDLTGMGRFLMMAAFGVFIAWMISIFVPGFQTIIAAVGAVVFAGLTSYYTQEIKQMYMVNGARGNLATLGALILYVNFINLFIMILQLFLSRD